MVAVVAVVALWLLGAVAASQVELFGIPYRQDEGVRSIRERLLVGL